MNELFGWGWITLGLIGGMVLGLFFHREDWLGGYSSYRRRLVRLGHIAFLGLGILNVLAAKSLPNALLDPLAELLVEWGFIVAAVSMPLCCFAVAWRPRLKPLFAIPVASAITAGVVLTRGLWLMAYAEDLGVTR